MKRFLPRSLLGQVMLVLALGLLFGQMVAAMFLYQAAEQRREAAVANSFAFRLIADGPRRLGQNRQERLAELRERGIPNGLPLRPRPGRPLRLGIERTEELPINPDERRFEGYEEALKNVLDQQGMAVAEVAITRRIAGDDPYVRELFRQRPRLRSLELGDITLLLASIRTEGEERWITARLPEPQPQKGVLATIALQTFVIFIFLFALLYFVLRRLTRPLAQLTSRVADFSLQPDQAMQLEESGPADVRELIAAHNAMEARISALLDEKNVMLGAIGHDLKTPLAALRVRIESVADATQRERMAQSIEDITRTLDDILSLARIGRSGQLPEQLDLGSLALSVVEEFEDLGQPVTMGETERIVAPVHVTWAKRALRNLVSNAVRYAGSAEVSLTEENGMAILRVEDSGPGIPEEQILDMLEPFTRGEASRNRATGGAGLGLTLARAIAEQHGGSLTLTNRNEGGQIAGLRAELRLPLA
ncbi:MAG: ATP-binding protein [Pseudomonadota bacterium]